MLIALPLLKRWTLWPLNIGSRAILIWGCTFRKSHARFHLLIIHEILSDKSSLYPRIVFHPFLIKRLFWDVRRRISSSSIENGDDEDDYDETDRIDHEKLRRAVEQLDTYDKDSSIAHVIKQNFEEVHKKQRFILATIYIF